MKHSITRMAGLALLASFSNTQASNIELFNETFEAITSDYYNASCGWGCTHSIQNGIPVTDGGTSISGADNDWWGARFEFPDGGSIVSDVGVQETGGGTNTSPVGMVTDDAGLMFKLDTTGRQNIQLNFDWRTFKAGSGDQLIAGYFVGDFTAATGAPAFATDRTIDLRNAAHGGSDGSWNWNPINGGNTGNWIEVFRGNSQNSWLPESLTLDQADNQQEVWVAFWLDNGNKDFGKFDNVVVTADAVVPLPAAVWLFGSGLLGLVGIARRKTT